MALGVNAEVVFPQASVLPKERMEKREVSRDPEMGLGISLAVFVQLR